MKRLLAILQLCALLPLAGHAKIQTEFGDSTKTHVFTLKADLLTRGEYIQGAVADTTETFAAYVVERARICLHYQQPYLEMKIVPQHSGVWGTTNGGAFSLREAWAKTDVKGFFAQLGRQSLAYDDERVMGMDDWSMTGAYHDALKIGYEGFGHKVHLIGAYCQNNSNTNGGTVYLNGNQPYKNMEALWYHYDFRRWFSASLLFVNTGVQSGILDALGLPEKKTYYQQMLGTYWRFHMDENQTTNDQLPMTNSQWYIDVDASFYYQLGKTEANLPINAWMVATEAKAQANRWVRLNAGYFHLSGDENYTVPPPGAMGLQRHTHDHSFNLLFGSKHQFYGAMDFFYLKSFYGGYSPGLQDGHIGATFTYLDMFDLQAQYHCLATTVDVFRAPTRLLGHELELNANYRPASWVKLTASYTFMQGTKTMEMVKRASNRNQSHYVYLSVIFQPTLVKVRF